MELSVQAGQKDQRLNKLFIDLQNAPTVFESLTIEMQIWQIWIENDQDRVNELMQAGINAMQLRQYNIALENFNKVIQIAPDFAEGWNKRATVHYLMKNYKASIYDIRQTLTLEPRHFGALSGLGLVYGEMERYNEALRAFGAALKIYPQMRGAQENYKALKNHLKSKIL